MSPCLYLRSDNALICADKSKVCYDEYFSTGFNPSTNLSNFPGVKGPNTYASCNADNVCVCQAPLVQSTASVNFQGNPYCVGENTLATPVQPNITYHCLCLAVSVVSSLSTQHVELKSVLPLSCCDVTHSPCTQVRQWQRLRPDQICILHKQHLQLIQTSSAYQQKCDANNVCAK